MWTIGGPPARVGLPPSIPPLLLLLNSPLGSLLRPPPLPLFLFQLPFALQRSVLMITAKQRKAHEAAAGIIITHYNTMEDGRPFSLEEFFAVRMLQAAAKSFVERQRVRRKLEKEAWDLRVREAGERGGGIEPGGRNGPPYPPA